MEYEVIQPASGYLACGDAGAGKMPEAETLYQYIENTGRSEGSDWKKSIGYCGTYPGEH